MRLRQAMARLGNPEIAIMRVRAQTIGFEILVAIVADGDALLWAGALGGSLRASFRLAIFGLDCFSRGGLGSGLGGCFARRRFFLRGGAACGPRRRLLLGH